MSKLYTVAFRANLTDQLHKRNIHIRQVRAWPFCLFSGTRHWDSNRTTQDLPNISKFQFDLETVDRKSHPVNMLLLSDFLLSLLFIYPLGEIHGICTEYFANGVKFVYMHPIGDNRYNLLYEHKKGYNRK